MTSHKRDRLNNHIREVLSELLRREVSDPRLQGVTVTEVSLDPELLFARVYVNALGDETREEEVMLALKKANGFLRREMGRSVQLRNTPQLIFQWDAALEHGERLNQILDTLDIPPAEEDQEEEDDTILDD
mgnify:CR=1 FL=1